MDPLAAFAQESHDAALARVIERFGPEVGAAFTRMKDRIVANPETAEIDLNHMHHLINATVPAEDRMTGDDFLDWNPKLFPNPVGMLANDDPIMYFTKQPQQGQ